jgi:hypothetical protein
VERREARELHGCPTTPLFPDPAWTSLQFYFLECLIQRQTLREFFSVRYECGKKCSEILRAMYSTTGTVFGCTAYRQLVLVARSSHDFYLKFETTAVQYHIYIRKSFSDQIDEFISHLFLNPLFLSISTDTRGCTLHRTFKVESEHCSFV